MSLNELKQKIKDELPISVIISQYLALKKSGSTIVSICPFHSDSHPSMHVNDHLKIYKCFACGAAGDSVTFVMKYRHLNYQEALKEICDKNGINYAQFNEKEKRNPRVEMGKKILSKTSQLYRKMTTNNLLYKEFIISRNLSEETAKLYNLGVATSENSLLKYLQSIPDQNDRQLALEMAKELTLIKTNPHHSDNQYDTFRERIIFPIWDHFGTVIGFTSRATRPDQMPKYMNSKDSFLFNKSNLLYGLHLAKTSIREKDFVLLVEGNMDQISLFHHGFQNTVALMGTALGASSLDRLTTFTKNIYLALDNDSAGKMAAKRINQQFLEKGIIPKFIDFSPEKDPDDFLKKFGALKMQQKIDEAIPFIDMILEELIPNPIPEVIDRKLAILNTIFETLSPMKMELSATERIVKMARIIGIKTDSAGLLKIYENFLDKKIKPRFTHHDIKNDSTTEENLEFPPENLDPKEVSPEIKIPSQLLSKVEKIFLQELIQFPSLIIKGNITEVLDLVTSDEVKKYIGKVQKLLMEIDESEYSTVILNLCDTDSYSLDLKEAVASALFKYRPRECDSKTRKRIVHDLKIKLQTEQLLTQKAQLLQWQKTSESQDEINTFFKRITVIEKELQEIKKQRPPLN